MGRATSAERTGIGRRTLLTGASAAAGGLAAAAATPAAAAGADAASATRRRVRTGLEVLREEGYRPLRDRRIGILTNPTCVMPDLQHGVDILAAEPGVELTAVFGPEHGFRGTAQANDSEGSFTDPKTGLAVYDTFEKSGQELADIFSRSGVDTVVFDIQDVGARFYTYIWTMFDAMEAAALARMRFMVLDRPNPLTGLRALGPVLDRRFSSFIGREEIALQHGMTVGELAGLFNSEFLPGRPSGPVELDVVEMRGWHRRLSFEETGQPWVLPSPNMPTLDTAYVYPGSCLFSGTNISQGRGTTRPFQIVGAPFVDHRWAERLTALRLPGLAFREAHFAPTFSTYQGENCVGLDILVTDRSAVDAPRLGVALLTSLKELYPEDFAWLNTGTEAEPTWWIDHLTGSEYVRRAVDAGRSVDAITDGWSGDLAAFSRLRQRYLRY